MVDPQRTASTIIAIIDGALLQRILDPGRELAPILAGIEALYFAPGAGVVALIIAVLLGALSRSTKRSYDAVTRQD